MEDNKTQTNNSSNKRIQNYSKLVDTNSKTSDINKTQLNQNPPPIDSINSNQNPPPIDSKNSNQNPISQNPNNSNQNPPKVENSISQNHKSQPSAPQPLKPHALPQTFISKEQDFIEETSGKIPNQEELIKLRKERFIKLLKHDKYFTIFVLIGILSLIFSFLLKINFSLVIGVFSSKDWIILAVLSFISAGLVYFKKHNLMYYPILAWIVWLSVQIRTKNLPRLKDITTGAWTLGPDLDPFLFLRWAKSIVENGSLMVIDTMRYLPLGYNTRGELLLHPYLIAWFHKVAVYFGSESVTYSAIIYPVFMFALTVIAFFLFSRKIFTDSLGKDKANIIGLFSAFFLTIMPVLLPRTIAGIPEKESAAFFFMFIAFYFFISAWKSKGKKGILFSIGAGISTAAMALTWGGYAFIFLSIGPAVFMSFVLGNISKKKFHFYLTWLITSFAFMYPFSTRYTAKELLTSIDTGSSVIIAIIIAFHIYIFPKILEKIKSYKKLPNLPPQVYSISIILLISLIAIITLFGFSFITDKINSVVANLIKPATSRLIQTVAENRQPYFTEWSASFGPFVKGTPLLFWLFFFGSTYLFYKMIFFLKMSERILLTLSYLIFQSAVIFSRHSPSSTFNGTNTSSLLLYAFGFLLFVISVCYYYYQYHKKEESYKLKKIEFGFLLIFILYFLSVIGARGAVRLIMVLVPSVSIIVSYFLVEIFSNALKSKGDSTKIFAWILAGIILIATMFSGIQLYKVVSSQAANYAPSIYTQQWQKAMFYVRENTEQEAVFGHWWDYGYWLQSIGERATVLDGGNSISYWNHMMGRYALTGTNERTALEFLFAHNTTHFLIDSTDIGKYTAFSSIGSDVNYDRTSWIPVFQKDNNQISETKNSTVFAYTGGTGLDEDIIYDQEGSKVFLPEGGAGLAVILIERNKVGELEKQPRGVFVYQGAQYNLPLRYAFTNGELKDFGSGVEAGVFIFPRVNQNGEQLNVEFDGALIYLSKRTVKSQLAKLYFYKDPNSSFKLVHSEDDLFVSQLKSREPNTPDIVLFNGIRGPIRIWEINYPIDIELKQEYLQTDYPEEIRLAT